ncbi:MAG: hypothetical protein DWP92_11115 [Armatimonadetes bacterium]|nr:MAG: hypothetical protein DWP92_11115 [Armatimonadota bacterium]
MLKIRKRFMVPAAMMVVLAVLTGCAADDAAPLSDSVNPPSAAGACLEGVPDCNDTPGDLGLPPNLGEEPSDGPVVADDGISVVQALSEGGSDPIAVTGFFISDGSGAWLCEAMAESYPPQCGGERLSVSNPDAMGALVLIEEGDTQWYEGSLTLMGTVSDGTFTILTDPDG